MLVYILKRWKIIFLQKSHGSNLENDSYLLILKIEVFEFDHGSVAKNKFVEMTHFQNMHIDLR